MTGWCDSTALHGTLAMLPAALGMLFMGGSLLQPSCCALPAAH